MTVPADQPLRDPYRRCEHDPENDIRGACRHDLGQGYTLAMLLEDGPETAGLMNMREHLDRG